MYTAILSLFVVVAIILIVLVLIQHGKGADMGVSFGSGASGTLFGSSGTSDFLSKITWIFMIVFFVLCIIIANLSKPTNTSAYDNFSEVEVKKELKEVTQSVDSLIPGSDAVKAEVTSEKNKPAKTSIQDQVN